MHLVMGNPDVIFRGLNGCRILYLPPSLSLPHLPLFCYSKYCFSFITFLSLVNRTVPLTPETQISLRYLCYECGGLGVVPTVFFQVALWTATHVQVKYLGRIVQEISKRELVRLILITVQSCMPEGTEKSLHEDVIPVMNAPIN